MALTRAQLPHKVQEVIDRIGEGSDPEKIIVFGSYARGDWTDDSDLDVLVVKETRERWLARSPSRLCAGPDCCRWT